jgi:hypothetical protein
MRPSLNGIPHLLEFSTDLFDHLVPAFHATLAKNLQCMEVVTGLPSPCGSSNSSTIAWKSDEGDADLDPMYRFVSNRGTLLRTLCFIPGIGDARLK